MKKAAIFITGFIFLCVLSNAQDVTETITSNFFSSFQKDPAIAYSQLFAGSKWVSQTTIEANKTELTQFLNEIGTYYGYELITTKKIGESFILKSFLVKYERQPVRFSFLLYKPQNTWILQNFSWDSELENEIYEAASMNK